MKKRFAAIFVALAMVLSLVACTGVFAEQVEVKQVDMKFIKTNELKGQEKDYLILDVRKAADYLEAHIPSAALIDMDAAKEGNIEKGTLDMKAGMKKLTGSEQGGDKKIVLVCYSGKRYAQVSTNILAAIGANMDNVVTLEGGFTAWKKAYPKDVEVSDVSMKYITAKELKTVFDNKDDSYIIIDLRKASDNKKSRIPSSVAIDMDKAKDGNLVDGMDRLKAGLGDELNGDKKLVLVCYSGKKYAQAATDCLYLLDANMDNVLTLEGGFNGWSKAYPDAVEK